MLSYLLLRQKTKVSENTPYVALRIDWQACGKGVSGLVEASANIYSHREIVSGTIRNALGQLKL